MYTNCKLSGGQLKKIISHCVHIFIVSFPVWAGIKSSKLSYIDNSISCCVSMQHFITNKTQTTILEKTLNKNGNTSIPTIYKGQLTPEEDDKKLGIRLSHIFIPFPVVFVCRTLSQKMKENFYLRESSKSKFYLKICCTPTKVSYKLTQMTGSQGAGLVTR